MTTTSKPVRRETLTSARYRGKLRAIIIELASTYVVVRLKGTRVRYTATYDQVWKVGAENAARAARIERQLKRQRKDTQ
jgi:hypothetical protein